MTDAIVPPIEIHSRLLLTANDREHLNALSLVLSAKNINHSIRFESGNAIAIYVDDSTWLQASEEIAAYLEENRHWPRPILENDLPPPLFRAMSVVVSGSLAILYGLSGPWRPEGAWFQAGAGDGEAILNHGEFFRLATALTLHADAVHLLSNCVLGAVLLHYLLELTGNGIGLMLVLLTAITANGINVWVHGSSHHFVGFSTALFSAIGMLCTMGYSVSRSPSPRNLFMPLMAGLALLATLGVEGERTDLGSHLFGLLCGLACGPLAFLKGFRKMQASLLVQTLLSLAFFLTVVICWWLAWRLLPRT